MTERGEPELTVRLVDDPREVQRAAGAWLARHAVVANVPATVLAGEVSGERHYPDQTWALVSDADGRLVGLAMQTAPHNAFVPPIGPAAAVAVADAWHASGRALPGVISDDLAGEAFVRRWTEHVAVRARLEMREGLHVLGRFAPATGVPGAGRTADPDDLDLILRWLAAFADEAVPGAGEVVDRDEELGRIRLGMYLIWADGGEPVSLAGVKPPAAGVGRVGPVYTPPEHRRRGYAAAVTSLATQRLLDAGARAMLFTDLANPTSNGVYARLGYELVGELRRWSFR